MSELRIGKGIAALAMSLGIALLPASCTVIYIDGDCAETDHCYTEWNYAGNGTTCVAGRCACSSPTQIPCCPGGAERCENEVFDCRPATQCDSSVALPAGAPCLSDDQCEGPPDARCGVGRCKSGVCVVEVWVWMELKSQTPGDCKTTRCDVDGRTIELEDNGDVPRDGNPCTYDTCDTDNPINTALPDAYPCPDKELGICVSGHCEGCSNVVGAGTCPDDSVCFEGKCILKSCADETLNGQETDRDCGGSSCSPCESGKVCKIGSDCVSLVCQAGICKEATHDDNVKNDSETGVDCGYPEAPPNSCADGEGCKKSSDCLSVVCYYGVCQEPTCFDAVKNGSETGPDCGGSCDPCLE
jgi:hypothetical protein